MLKRAMSAVFGTAVAGAAPARSQRPMARLGCERFEDRINPAGWLDDYAAWFNRQVGDGYSDAVGGAIQSGLNSMGFTDAELAAKDDMQWLMGTTVVAVPLAIGLVAGGEVALGVGTVGGAAAAPAAAGTTGSAATVLAELQATQLALDSWLVTAGNLAPGSVFGSLAADRVLGLRAHIEGLQTVLLHIQ